MFCECCPKRIVGVGVGSFLEGERGQADWDLPFSCDFLDNGKSEKVVVGAEMVSKSGLVW